MNSVVNSLGKYLYHNLDSVYDYKRTSNSFDIYLTIVYTSTTDIQIEQNIDINITTYANKIRVNILEISNSEETIGYDLYDSDVFKDLYTGFKKVMNNIEKRISKAFKDYDFAS